MKVTVFEELDRLLATIGTTVKLMQYVLRYQDMRLMLTERRTNLELSSNCKVYY